MHVTADGPSEVGSSAEKPLSAALREYLRRDRFRALCASLKEPVVRQEHLASDVGDLEVEMVVAPLGGMEGKNGAAHKEMVVFAVDQTKRRVEEQKLYQLSKLASLGEVATGLAHEINQPLGVIRLAAANALTGIKKKMPPEHLAAKLDRIIQQTVRMSRIIDHMRIFGRKSDERVQPCRPTEAIEGAMQVVGAHFRLDNIEVITRFDDNVPEVLCRQAQLEQVLINLLQNARDAIQDKRKADADAFTGRIRIDVAVETTSVRRSVRIDVADNAGGIPPDIADRIFQPFFTTKPPGKGTGLGLSVSFGIIREHGGTISVANGPEGAVFTIGLLAVEDVPAAVENALPEATAATAPVAAEERSSAVSSLL
jgi:C4-dicarboxylate-specific signal transduction histidine kinase